MTDKEWKEEVAGVLAGGGLPWSVAAAWVEQASAMCCADVVDQRSGKERSIRLSRQHFQTAPARRAEIVRQLEK